VSSPRRKRKPTFVLVIPRFEDIYHSYFAGEIIKGVSLAASHINADIVLRITDRSNHKGWLDSTLMDPSYVHGILFADIDNDLGVVKRAIRSGVPCLVLNNILSEPINYVAMDNKKAAYDLVSDLIRVGHKKIATIAGDVSTQAGLMRLEGYKDALESGVIRPPKGSTADYPYFKKGVPLDKRYANPTIEGASYEGPYMAESIGNKMVQNNKAFYAPDKDVFIPRRELNINNPNLKFYKEHWLQGYKEVPKKQKGGSTNWLDSY